MTSDNLDYNDYLKIGGIKILLNKKFIVNTALRIIFFIFLAFSIITLSLLFQKKVDEKLGFIVLYILVFGGIGALFYLRYMMKKITYNIEIDDNLLKYPRFYFWRNFIPIKTIYSVEEIVGIGKSRSLVIGLKNGRSLWFGSDIFKNNEEYLKFKNNILSIYSNDMRDICGKCLHVIDQSYTHIFVQMIFVVIWISVYILSKYLTNIDYDQFFEIGALTKNVKEGEDLYRLSSWFFLHSGIIHALLNILIFAISSESLLRIVNTYRYLCILFVSTMAASILTLYISPYEYVVGASGGVFGLFGAFCSVKLNNQLPGTVSKASDNMIYFVVLLEVFGETISDGIDSYAHAGGFLSGYLLMKLYLRYSRDNSIYDSTRGEKVLAMVLSLGYLLGLLRFLWLVSKAYA